MQKKNSVQMIKNVKRLVTIAITPKNIEELLTIFSI